MRKSKVVLSLQNDLKKPWHVLGKENNENH